MTDREQPSQIDLDDDTPPWERSAPAAEPSLEAADGTAANWAQPAIGQSPLARDLDEDGTFGRLQLRQQVERRDAEDAAQRTSSKALLGDWDTLDDKGRADWIKGEKDYTEKAAGWWQWLHDNVSAPSQANLQAAGRQISDEDTWLNRKIKEQIAFHKQRRQNADLMEMGLKEAPKYGTARQIVEGTAKGVLDGVVANTLKGLSYAGAAIEGLQSVTGYDWNAPDDKSPLQGFDAKPLGKVQERALYKMGQDVSDWANARFPTDKARAEEFKTQFAQGLGSMIGFMGPAAALNVARFGMQRAGMSLLPDIIATVANPATVSGTTGALAQMGSMGDDALKAFKAGKIIDGAPVDENSILAAILLAVPIGASEAAPIAHLFNGQKGAWLKRIFAQAYEEGGQEFAQQIAENVTARALYDDKRQWDDSAWDGLLIGGLLGAKSQIIADTYRHFRGLEQEGVPEPATKPVREAKVRGGATRTDVEPAAQAPQDAAAGQPAQPSFFAGTELPAPAAQGSEQEPYEAPRIAAMVRKRPEGARLGKGLDEIKPTGGAEAVDRVAGVPQSTEGVQPGLAVGDEVQWTSGGVDQLPEPRKITWLSPDGQWAIVEGSNTGLPVAELSRAAPAWQRELTATLEEIARPLSEAERARIESDVEANLAGFAADMEAVYADRGLNWDLGDEDVKSVAFHMAQGLTAEEALERYAVEGYESERQERAAVGSRQSAVGATGTAGGGPAGQAGAQAQPGAAGGEPGAARPGGPAAQGVGGAGAGPGPARAAAPPGQPQRGVQPATAREPSPAERDYDRALRQAFRAFLAGKGRIEEWAGRNKVAPDKLAAITEEAIAAGLLQRYGGPNLKRAITSAPTPEIAAELDRYATARAAGDGAPDLSPEALAHLATHVPIRRTPRARTLPREARTLPQAETLAIPPDVRLERAIALRQAETGRPVEGLIRRYAEAIEETRGTPRFARELRTLIDAAKAGRINKAQALELAHLVGYRPKAKTSKAEALKSIEQRHKDLVKGLEARARAGTAGQVLAAIAGAVDEGQAQKRAFDQLGFYSHALEAARALKQEKGTAEQFLSMLKSAGVKEAEIRATKLDEFLGRETGQQAGTAKRPSSTEASASAAEGLPTAEASRAVSRPKRTVTKSEIVAFLEKNRVAVREKVYGDPANRRSARELAEASGDTWSDLGPNGRQRYEDQAERGDTKWSQYSLDPSNPTYRETVLHLPSLAEARLERVRSMRAEYDRNPTPELRAAIEREAQDPTAAREIADVFRGGHWDEPNVIAHMRTSIQKDAQGRPVFLLDELQSDWGQKLREGGVRDEAKIAELRQQIADAQAALDPVLAEAKRLTGANDDAVGQELRNLAFRKTPGKAPGLLNNEAKYAQALELAPRLEAAENALRLKQAELRTAEAATPGHPLVNTTDQWTTTAFRRLIRQAVEAGAEKIAIVPGKEQVARYPNLRQIVEGIEVVPNDKGRRVVFRMREGGRSVVADVDQAGTITSGQLPNGVGRSLRDAVGQEPAEQIMAVTERTTLPANDLDVGEGKGMLYAYDQMYPRMLGKLLSKMDPSIKMETVPLRSSVDDRTFMPKGEVEERDNADQILQGVNGDVDAAIKVARQQRADIAAQGDTALTEMRVAEAERTLAILQQIKDGKRPAQVEPIQFHTFPLTDKVKEKVMAEGQALFAIASQRSRFAAEGRSDVLAAFQSAGAASFLRARGIPKTADPPIASYTRDTDIKAHPDYKAAKAGDREAAGRLVVALVAPANLAEARQRFGADAIYTPVIAEEATGRNKIPEALAQFYAASTGATAESGIIQVSRAFHTGARPMERLIARPVFDGAISRGSRYVLVDDVSVMGGTLAELAHHIQAGGGEVAGVVTLANTSRSRVLSPTPKQVRQIEERYGDTIRDGFGIEPAALTADEASYILNFRDADALRASVAKARGERDERLLSKGLRPPATEGGDGLAALAETAPQFTPRFREALPAFAAEVEANLRRMLPEDIAVRMADRLFAGGYEHFGGYLMDDRLVEVALAYGQRTAEVKGFHEVGHALREYGRQWGEIAAGLYTDAEWQVLTERARKVGIGFEPVYRESYRARAELEGLTGKDADARVEELLDQERVFTLAEQWAAGTDFGSRVNSLLERIGRFFEAIRNALRGLGFQTAEDVFERMASGEIAERAGPREPAFAAEQSGPSPQAMMLATPEGQAALGEMGLAAIRAFHGSPYDFDQFDISRIGTGEGAQAFGHGLYFAGREGVARYYQRALSVARGPAGPLQSVKGWPPELRQKYDARLAELRKERAAAHTQATQSGDWSRWQSAEAAINTLLENPQSALTEAEQAALPPPGRLYEVKLNVEDDELLDWDKSLKQQPKAVLDFLHQRIAATVPVTRMSERELADLRKRIRKDFDSKAKSGWTLGNYLRDNNLFPPDRVQFASEAKTAGFKGIRYLDQGSRAKGEGTYNYVIFSDQDVEIVAKDGKPVSREEKAAVIADTQASRPGVDDQGQMLFALAGPAPSPTVRPFSLPGYEGGEVAESLKEDGTRLRVYRVGLGRETAQQSYAAERPSSSEALEAVADAERWEKRRGLAEHKLIAEARKQGTWPEWGDKFPERALLSLKEQKAREAWDAVVHPIMYPDGLKVMEREAAEAKAMEVSPKVGLAYQEARRRWLEHDKGRALTPGELAWEGLDRPPGAPAPSAAELMSGYGRERFKVVGHPELAARRRAAALPTANRPRAEGLPSPDTGASVSRPKASLIVSEQPDGAWELSFFRADQVADVGRMVSAIESDLGVPLGASGWITPAAYQNLAQSRPDLVAEHQDAGPLFAGMYAPPKAVALARAVLGAETAPGPDASARTNQAPGQAAPSGAGTAAGRPAASAAVERQLARLEEMAGETGRAAGVTAPSATADASGALNQDQAPATPGLDMSPQARKARAEAMGFDTSTVYYHGTEVDFAAPRGVFFITDNGEMASKFADSSLAQKGVTGGRVLPLWIKRQGIADLSSKADLERIAQALVEQTPRYDRNDGAGVRSLTIEEARAQLADPRNISDGRANWAVEPIIDAAKRAGFAGIPVRENWKQWGWADAHSIAMFPDNAPGNIRSVNAAFDPAQEGSSQLLAAIKGPTRIEPALRDTKSPTPASGFNPRAPGLGHPPRALTALVADLKAMLGMPTTQGLVGLRVRDEAGDRSYRMRPTSRVAGQYQNPPGAARIRLSTDIEAIAHEGGHHLEAVIGAPLRNLMTTHQAELLAYAGGVASAVPGDPAFLSEGFAEFFREFVLDPEKAETAAPQFYKAFADLLDSERPDILDGLDRLQLNLLSREYQDYLKATAVERGMADVATWAEPTAWERIKAFYRSSDRAETIRQWLSLFSYTTLDKTNPILKAQQALLALADRNGVRDADGRPISLQAGENAHRISRLMARTDRIGHAMLLNGIPEYGALEAKGPSLNDAIAEALGGRRRFQWTDAALKRFGLYLEARRAVVEWQRYQAGELQRPPTRKTQEEYFAIIDRLERANPSFQRAAQMVYDYQHRLLTLEWQAGKWTDEQYEALSARKDWYVPFQRDLSDVLPMTGPGERLARRFTAMRQFKGSDRNIINPLEVIARRTYETAAAIQFNDMVKALADLADRAGIGAAGLIERVSREEVRQANAQTFEELKSLAVANGMDEADAHMLIQSMEMNFQDTDMHLLWAPTNFGPQRPPMVPLWENGERKLVRLNDPVMGRRLFEAMNQIGREQSGWLINLIAKPAAILRAGVTMHPAFVLANIMGDMMASFVLTGNILRPSTYPGVTQLRGAGLLLASNPTVRAGLEKMGITPSRFAELYTRVGGISGGQNVSAMRAVRDDLDLKELRSKGFTIAALPAVFGTATTLAGAAAGGVVGGPVGATVGAGFGAIAARLMFGKGAEEFFARASDFSETITRLGVASAAFKRAKTLDPAMSDIDAMREAAYTASDVLDFDRSGAKIGTALRLISFLNSNLQGVSKAYRQSLVLDGERGRINTAKVGLFLRHMLTRTGGEAMRQALSPADEKAIADGLRQWINMGLLAAVGATLTLLYLDDDDRKEVATDQQKYTHWIFKLGDTWVRVKKPFELATLSNIAESVLEWAVGNDPRLASKLFHSIKETHAPPIVPQIGNLAASLATGVDIRTGRPIVPQRLEGLDPYLQFDHYTSQFALEWSKALWKMGVPVSPLQIDYALNNSLAYWGREIGVSSNYFFGPNREAPKWTDVPIAGTMINRVTLDPARTSASRDEFWKQMGTGRGPFARAKASYDELLKSGSSEAVQAYLAGLEEPQRIYAVLNKHFPEGTRTAHPLNRADRIRAVQDGMLREMILERLVDGASKEKIVLSPAKQKEVRDIVGRLTGLEVWNGLHLAGVKGWAQENVRDPQPVLDELKAASEPFHDELLRRRRKAHIGDFADDRARWVDVRQRVVDLINDDDMLGVQWNKTVRKRRTPTLRLAPPSPGGPSFRIPAPGAAPPGIIVQ